MVEQSSYKFEHLNEHQLVQIAFSDEDQGYESLARQSALEELHRRKIDFAEIRSIGNEINMTFWDDVERAYMPLQRWIAAVIILSAVTWVIPSLISARMSSRGYYKKVEDARIAFRIGLILWLGGMTVLIYFFG